MTSGFSYLKDDIKEEIRRVAGKTLKKARCSDPPVIIEPVYKIHNLQKKIFLKEDPEFIELSKKAGSNNPDILRGVLFVKDGLAVARDDGYDRRTKFVFIHELGHWNLPWHKQMLYKCTQFDLSPSARKQMEREANFYAGELCFMGDKFTESLFYSELSFNRIKDLADLFQMSKESTLRRTVELEHRPCAFITLDVNEKDDKNFLKVKYPVHSESFKKDYGEFSRTQTFPKGHVLSQVRVNMIKRALKHDNAIVKFGEKKVELNAEIWFNGYNVLAFFQPAK